jgi:hypothetical protein
MLDQNRNARRKRTLTVVPISVPIGWVKIGFRSWFATSAIWSAGLPTQIRGLIPEIPRHGEVQDVIVLRVDLCADGNNLSIGLY